MNQNSERPLSSHAIKPQQKRNIEDCSKLRGIYHEEPNPENGKDLSRIRP